VIEPEVKELAKGANFGSITTLRKDGSPTTSVMWVDADDDHILVNTEVHRAKYKNVQRDPRVSVVIWESDPNGYAEVRGRVVGEIREPEARAHIDELSQKYEGHPFENPVVSERVILKIAPDSQRIYR
jgi:PPOX class probable F420-dependent enzyme